MMQHFGSLKSRDKQMPFVTVCRSKQGLVYDLPPCMYLFYTLSFLLTTENGFIHCIRPKIYADILYSFIKLDHLNILAYVNVHIFQ